MEKEAATSLKGTAEDNPEDYKQKLRKEEIDAALEKICKEQKLWLYFMFFITASPGILNGMHLMSYVFYVDTQPHYCNIPELEKAGWTSEQIKNVSLVRSQTSSYDGCEFYNYDYSKMATQSYDAAFYFVEATKNKTKILPCTDFKYENNYSVISEWNLVCDRFIYRSNIQAAYAIGKFVGASFFGSLSDKYGRRFGFIMASLCYVISAFLAPFSGAYGIFLFVRFLIGISGVGCYGTVYTLLTEILVGSTKIWICCVFNASYPVGMILLSLIAYHVRYWKSLQIIMSIPTIILPFYYWILPESPQWLLSKNRFEEAWHVIQRIDPTLKPVLDGPKVDHQNFEHKEEKIPIAKRLMLPFTKFTSLFSTTSLSIRTFVCFFSWFTVSTTYFGLAMNGENFAVGKYLYTLLNGILEIISYIVPIYILSISGRKTASMLLFSITGVSLISIMFVPRSFKTVILIVALLGRLCDSSVYVILALYTAELYPTAVRNTALGASVTMSHMGTLVSPYITDILGAYTWYIPSTIFGSLCICVIFLLVLLPETKNRPTFNTVEEMIQEAKTKVMLKNNRQS